MRYNNVGYYRGYAPLLKLILRFENVGALLGMLELLQWAIDSLQPVWAPELHRCSAQQLVKLLIIEANFDVLLQFLHWAASTQRVP